jgi:hypothetical protein
LLAGDVGLPRRLGDARQNALIANLDAEAQFAEFFDFRSLESVLALNLPKVE